MSEYLKKKLANYFVVLICGIVLLISLPFAIDSIKTNKHKGKPFSITTNNTLVGPLSETTQLDSKNKQSQTIHISNFPVKGGHLSSRFGMRKDPFHGMRRMHKGIDIAAKKGSFIHPMGKGTVIFAGRKAGYGKMIEIKHGNTIITRYAHLDTILIEKGKQVLPADIIGLVGKTGRSTGPHLHLEVSLNKKLVDPQIFLLKEYVGR